MGKRILDPCCGPRSWWFDRQHADVVFGDVRSEVVEVTDRSHGKAEGKRSLQIRPDCLMDFRKLPFLDETFWLVAFDPPHILRAGPQSWMAARYGRLSDDWREDLAQGFRECFRVLRANGTMVFKWNETHIKLSEILPLSPYKPLFGQISGRRGMTHWLTFMKPPASQVESHQRGE